MTQHFDIAILGSGPGGYVAGLRAAQLGARVAVVEQRHLGGTCLNDGCIPSKALLASAELLHRIRGARELGVEAAGLTFDWARIQARKDEIIRKLRRGIGSLFESRKVTAFEGRGVLEGPGRLAVIKDGRPREEIAADKTILAVGSVPARIPGWPADPQRICTSDEALHWKTLPGRLLIVGGGIIGCEFACMMQAFGVAVSVVEMMPRLMPELDGDLGAAMQKVFARRGIAVHVGVKVRDMTAGDPGIRATLDTGDSIEADRVLVAVGRRPNTAGIGLETAGLSTERGFVRVNDFMETATGGTYCIGDANGRCLLAHAASAQALAAVENALGGKRPFQAPIPSCVYTFPEVAAVGITQEQARANGIPIAIGAMPLAHLGKAMAVGETEGFVKVIRHRQDGRLLGVHMMGHNVTECVAAATAVMHHKLTAAQMAEVVFAHPTISEAMKESAEDALGAALHLPPRKLLRVASG